MNKLAIFRIKWCLDLSILNWHFKIVGLLIQNTICGFPVLKQIKQKLIASCVTAWLIWFVIWLIDDLIDLIWFDLWRCHSTLFTPKRAETPAPREKTKQMLLEHSLVLNLPQNLHNQTLRMQSVAPVPERFQHHSCLLLWMRIV